MKVCYHLILPQNLLIYNSLFVVTRFMCLFSSPDFAAIYAKQQQMMQEIDFDEDMLALLKVEFNSYDADHSGRFVFRLELIPFKHMRAAKNYSTFDIFCLCFCNDSIDFDELTCAFKHLKVYKGPEHTQQLIDSIDKVLYIRS